ncbi:hypothetical protein [Nocardioides psychrotolerans]|uniref:hypothetical protein n=1 Tax=Nocardioides psychrotolerans TaxID=1005945 RepID=UPI003137A09E
MSSVAVLTRAPGDPAPGAESDDLDAAEPARRPGSWPAHWPLTALFVGFPLWWALGIDSLLPLLLAVPMAAQLWRRRSLRLPAGFGFWCLFLVWVVMGVVLLWADAPGAVPGGDSSRLLLFAYRIAWYAACTVVLLWVTNLRRSDLPDEHVRRLVAWMFVVATAGGLLGLLAPSFSFTSALELLLPTSIRSNQFVASLVHPEAADVQLVLGYPETRPKAPFPFTNTWGSMLSLSLVFVAALDLRRRHVTRALLALVALTALVPVVYSLNRGLWASLALGLLGVVVLRVLRGHRAMALGLVVAIAFGAVALLASPLGDLYQGRLENGHSNDRRGQLLSVTTEAVTQGSPVLGFGSTRDVQGSFASITGASTPDCPACGVPPMGTQGQLWLVLFSQGWLGLAFFLGFVALALSRTWRCRTTNETVCLFVLGFFIVQLPIYDTLGLPLYVTMIAIGLVAREQAAGAGREPGGGRWARVRALGVRNLLVLVLTPAAVGGLVGAGVAGATAEPTFRARVSILITPSPVYLDTGAPEVDDEETDEDPPREITVDTEAALLESERALGRAADASGIDSVELRDSIAVTAEPNSQILVLTVDAGDAERADAGAQAVADSYLQEREAFLIQRRDRLVEQLRDELASLDPAVRSLAGDRELVTAQIDFLETSTATIGRVVRHEDATAVRRQSEVPIASGAALGLLLGVVAVRRLSAHRRPLGAPRPRRVR